MRDGLLLSMLLKSSSWEEVLAVAKDVETEGPLGVELEALELECEAEADAEADWDAADADAEAEDAMLISE